MLSWILSAWVCISFVVFVAAQGLLTSKRIVQWFDRQRTLSHPVSVQQTLNILNFEPDLKSTNTARHMRIDQGG